MPANELPDDLNDWPRDPHELLGIARGATRREVRLAYTRLLRKYKPEILPDHFRRIREAYEQILSYAAWRGDQDSDDTTRSKTASDDADNLEVRNERARDSAHEPIVLPTDEGDDLWKQACNGDRAGAYRRLVECQQHTAAVQGIYAMLYWLLSVEPQLDAARVPCDWLVQGMVHCGSRGLLGELYERELRAQPEETRSHRFATLMSTGAELVSAGRFYRSRWNAMAGRADNLKTILVDLRSLRERTQNLPHESEQLLLAALTHLAWLRQTIGGQAAFDRYWQDASEMDVLDWQNSPLLDELDFNVEVAAECFALKTEGPQRRLRDAVEAFCRLPLARARPVIHRWLRDLAEQPQSALATCDMLRSRAPFVLARLVEALSVFCSYDDALSDEYDVELEPAVFGFFNRRRRAAYEKLRPEVLEFCLNEAILPHDMAAVLREYASEIRGQLPKFAEALDADAALRAVCLGHRLFWV